MMIRLERSVEKICDWLARNTSPRGQLAYTAVAAAGVPINMHLPVDRRDAGHKAEGSEWALNWALNEELLVGFLFSVLSWAGIAAAAQKAKEALAKLAQTAAALVEQAEKQAGGAPKCTNPQYCNMHGNPCACCGGSDKACPIGTVRGHYWSYCCSKTTIWFLDCCGGTVTCPTSCVWCDNSSQPNWCLSYGGSRYVCTLAEDHGPC
jgi:hypothetical protein